MLLLLMKYIFPLICYVTENYLRKLLSAIR